MRTTAWGPIVVALAAACGGGSSVDTIDASVPGVDARPSIDAAPSADATVPVPDAPLPDARPPDAAPQPPDAPPPPDAAPPPDAPPPPPDAAPPADAGPSLGVFIVGGPITVARWGSGNVLVTLSRENVPGLVTLELVSPPPGIGGSFLPNPANGITSSLRINPTNEAPLGDNTLTVRASSGGVSGTATVVVTILPYVISGKVVDANGDPAAGAALSVGSSTTTTDAGGNFTLVDVPRPFDLDVVSADKLSVVRYVGLTRIDPIVQLLAPTVPLQSGHVAGSAPTTGNNGGISFGSTATRARASAFTYAAGAYDATVSWHGASNISGTLHFLRFTTGGGEITQYDGFASRDVSVTQGQTTSSQNVATLTVVPTGALAGNFTGGGGASIIVQLVVRYTTGDAMVLNNAYLQTFGLITPMVPGSSVDLLGSYVTQDGASLAQMAGPFSNGTVNIIVNMPAPMKVLGPATGATGVDETTVFSYTPLAAGVHTLIAFKPGSPTYATVTAAGTATLPFSARTPPAGAGYNWFVKGYGPFATVDAAAVAGGELMDAIQPSPLPRHGHYLGAAGPSRAFTTAP